MTAKSCNQHVVSLVEWEGLSVRVDASAANALKVMELLQDEAVSDSTRGMLLARLLFIDADAVMGRISDVSGLIDAAMWEVFGIDDEDGSKGGKSSEIIDWEADREMMAASLLATYGRTFDELAESTRFRAFASLLAFVNADTPFGRALHYRTADEPKLTKYNAEEVEHFRKMRRLFAIRRKDDGESANDRMTDAFEVLKRKAERK